MFELHQLNVQLLVGHDIYVSIEHCLDEWSCACTQACTVNDTCHNNKTDATNTCLLLFSTTYL